MSDINEYLTQEKFDELSKELDHLKKVKRKEVAENLEYAKALGDLSENAEYHEARELQANTEDRILKLEMILKSAVIVSDKHTDAVSIGSTVLVQNEKDSLEKKYTIVGSEEADVLTGKISIHSPLGEAILGKRKGDKFTFTTPNGTARYTIIAIK